jgi:hypothetical protein
MDSWGIFRGTDEAEQARRTAEEGRAVTCVPRSVSADWLGQVCRDAGVTVRLRFRFPDARSATVSISAGTLEITSHEPDGAHGDGPVDAVVELTGDDYIRLLHPEREPVASRPPSYRLSGDAGALGALIGCLS